MGFLQNVSFAAALAPKLIGYRLSKSGLMKPPMPIILVYSVTSACQSLCKSCNIGLVYQKNPSVIKNDLKIDEIEKTFKSVGSVFYFNISGGEPFLRADLPQIVELACKYLKPKVIHVPTNALAPELIEKKTREIMEIIKKYGDKTIFTIKPSYDGIGEDHDYIRGVKGNFAKLMDTLERLKKLRNEYKNLEVGLGTVISKLNMHKIKEIADYAKKQDVDTYISEIAEKREEMFNLKDDVTPSADEYEKTIGLFKEEIRKNMKGRSFLSKFIQAFRLTYYDIAVRIIKEHRQVIQCYGGSGSVHLNAQGNLWPCATLAYSKVMGNIRDFNYDFKKLYYSDNAKEVRDYVFAKKCACPLAGVSYVNIPLSLRALASLAKNMLLN